MLCNVTMKRTEDSAIRREREIEVRLGECFNIYVMVTKVKVIVAQSCLTPFHLMGCNPPGFSVLGILQARILEWVIIFFSRGSS